MSNEASIFDEINIINRQLEKKSMVYGKKNAVFGFQRKNTKTYSLRISWVFYQCSEV